MLGRYRAEIRADLLQVYGVDLAAWWHARRWRALLELIDQLPEASRFREAVLNDRDVVGELLDSEGSGSGWAPRVSDFDLHATYLRDLVHSVHQLIAVTVATAGGKPPRVQPPPAPRTVLEEARREKAKDWARGVLSRVLPG